MADIRLVLEECGRLLQEQCRKDFMAILDDGMKERIVESVRRTIPNAEVSNVRLDPDDGQLKFDLKLPVEVKTDGVS